jgi:hypothetical protein
MNWILADICTFVLDRATRCFVEDADFAMERFKEVPANEERRFGKAHLRWRDAIPAYYLISEPFVNFVSGSFSAGINEFKVLSSYFMFATGFCCLKIMYSTRMSTLILVPTNMQHFKNANNKNHFPVYELNFAIQAINC